VATPRSDWTSDDALRRGKRHVAGGMEAPTFCDERRRQDSCTFPFA
jgi:hypothetical protein